MIQNLDKRNYTSINDPQNYLIEINNENQSYLKKIFDKEILEIFNMEVSNLKCDTIKDGVTKYSILYEKYIKILYRKQNDKEIDENFAKEVLSGKLNLVFGDSLELLKKLPSESIQVMVTSPPYYNAREYSNWNNIDIYLEDMEQIIKESYRVLDNHRAFIFNVGDIFDNPNTKTKSTWGKERIPLGSYFVNIFEKVGFKFVDDIIWDKGEVQSSRHKNSFRPFPLYQYPINSYEHIFVFMKHRLDKYRYPCPVCGSLKVSGNTQSEPGIQSWECKNYRCFERSKSNRGKRFSLISNIKQRNQNKDNVIDNSVIEKWRKDIVKFGPVIKINSKGKNTLGHTAPYPEDIPEYAVKAFSFIGESVLDPFAGSFTSAIVAAKNKRIGIGFELHKENINVAKRRMEQLNCYCKYKIVYYDDESKKLLINHHEMKTIGDFL
jgi:DNA modification methylase